MAEFCALGFVGWLLLWLQKPARLLFVAFCRSFDGRFALVSTTGATRNATRRFIILKFPSSTKSPNPIPGRVISGLPASVTFMAGLNEIRGYDSIDPARMVDLFETAADPRAGHPSPCADSIFHTDSEILAAVRPAASRPFWICSTCDMSFFAVPLHHQFIPAFQGDDYWVLINSNALPRTFIPKSVKTVASDDEAIGEHWPRHSSIPPTWPMSNRPLNCPPSVAAPPKSQTKFRPTSWSRCRWKRRDWSCWLTIGTRAGGHIGMANPCRFFGQTMPFAALWCRREAEPWNLFTGRPA